jgi:hypothetical protein
VRGREKERERKIGPNLHCDPNQYRDPNLYRDAEVDNVAVRDLPASVVEREEVRPRKRRQLQA